MSENEKLKEAINIIMNDSNKIEPRKGYAGLKSGAAIAHEMKEGFKKYENQIMHMWQESLIYGKAGILIGTPKDKLDGLHYSSIILDDEFETDEEYDEIDPMDDLIDELKAGQRALVSVGIRNCPYLFNNVVSKMYEVIQAIWEARYEK